MSKISEATAAHAEALRSGTAAEAKAARDKAIAVYDQATEAEKNAAFPHRLG